MHEFSIAISIIESVEKEAVNVKAKSISSVDLDIGTMAGVEFDALDTALEAAIRGTMLEKSQIRIHKVQAMTRCKDCGHHFEINDFLTPCPVCNGLFNDVYEGKELKIKSIVVDT